MMAKSSAMRDVESINTRSIAALNDKLAAVPSRLKPIRLVDTKTLTRDAWLSVRQQGIGSSDASAAVGLNPYKSALELWLEKSGKLTQAAACAEGEDQSPLYWGTVLESVVADHYARKTGRKVRRVNAVLQHAQHPWMLANVDRQIVGDDAVQLLECKTAGMYNAKQWREGVPEYVQLQVQHQLAVTGYQAADVAVLIGGNDFKIYRLERDEALIEQLILLEAQFWQSVIDGVAPSADGSDSAHKALGLLFTSDAGSVLDWQEHEVMNRQFNELARVRDELAVLEKQEAVLRQSIQQAMGDASKAVFAQGEVSWRRSADGLVFDKKRFEQEQPDFYAYYQVAKAGVRRFVMQVHQSVTKE